MVTRGGLCTDEARAETDTRSRGGGEEASPFSLRSSGLLVSVGGEGGEMDPLRTGGDGGPKEEDEFDKKLSKLEAMLPSGVFSIWGTSCAWIRRSS